MATAHGADATVNYASEKLTERVMALTGDKGADVCFDPVGGELFDAALSALGWGGRILLVGFVGGVPQIPANRLLVKHRSALGSSLRYFRWHAPDKLERSVAELLRWHGEGKLRPCITHRLPLERARGGDPPADRPPGARQDRGRAGARMTEIHLSRPARHVALITIDNQPKMNAMTRPMLAELGRLWDELERDDMPLHRRHRRGRACLHRRRRCQRRSVGRAGDGAHGQPRAAEDRRLHESRSSPRSTATASAAASSCCSRPTSAPRCRRRASA